MDRATALYARVSTDEQAEHGTSLDVQVAECRRHAESLGAGACISYVDAGVSGTILDRPALTRLRADVREGRVGLVVCFDPDRLSRNLGHLLLLVDELRGYGVAVEFSNFAMSPSADGRLLFAMRGAIAEFETHKIRQRMTAGKIARAREGRPVGGGHQIYGYAYDRGRGRFVPDPVQAPVVRLIFRLAEEHGTHAIARRLNAAGLPTRHGGAWSQTSVYGILHNATYLGQMPQMGGVGHVAVPPLVAGDLFARAQTAVAGRRNRPRGPARRPYLLRGRLRCGVCGRHMSGGHGQRTAHGYVTRYACTGKRSPSSCPSSYYRSVAVDEAVWSAVRGLVGQVDPALVAARLEALWQGAGSSPSPALAAPAGEAGGERAFERQRRRLWRAWRAELMTDEELARQLAEIDAAKALADEDRARAHRADPSRAHELVRRAVDAIERSMDLEDRRLVLDALDVDVILGPGTAGELRLNAPAGGT